jgi:hypothetical protein
MKNALCCLSRIVVPLLLSFTVSAQQASITGGLSGEITDSTGAILPGATVTLVGPQGSRVLTTDSSGRFSISGLTPGLYDVTVEKTGFKKLEAKQNEVVVNSSSTLNLTLQPGSASETVKVTAEAVAIDTQNTAVTTNLTDIFYNSVPMPRNVTAIFYAAPGVSSGQIAGSYYQIGPGPANPSIGGASALENLYVVDGVTITDQAYGSIGTYNRQKGALGTGVNLAFIKEVDVKTTAFEPQYGKATGGIVQIVTKSGSNSFHGALGAYFQPGQFFAPRYQYYQFGYLQAAPKQTLSDPQYDLAAELGGYIFKDRLFFFGAFDPALTQSIALANPASPIAYAHGPYDYNTTGLSWAGKLTYKLGPITTFEASSFGDPSRRNFNPNALQTTDPLSVSSAYDFGSLDAVARITTAITSTWTADASYAYNHNHFNEYPLQNNYRVVDTSGQYMPPGQTTGAVATGFGVYEPSRNNTYSISANSSKTFRFFGQHTFSAGYSYDHTNFLDQPSRSGPLFAIPSANVAGTPLTSLFGNIPANAIGSLANSAFTIAPANTDSATTTTDHTCTLCPINSRGQSVYASSSGTYIGFNVQTSARYHTAFVNDIYQMSRSITLDLGLRWEQERIAGALISYAFTGSWSPRLGINIDPLGDHKSKLFFNYGRNYWAMPLDAAIRELGNTQSVDGLVFAPVINPDGSYTIIPDSAHLLNGLPRATNRAGVISKFGSPGFPTTTGEPIIPGTKGEYEDEYVIGIERNVATSIVIKARWTDRRVGRAIEDIGSQSPEGSTIIPNYNGGIANPTPRTDIAINEHEITYTPAQFNVAQAQSAASGGDYVAPVAGCTVDNDPQILFINGKNQPVGGACFTNIDTADAPSGDGIPDGFVKPVRRYQAAEIEFDKRFSNQWMAVINFRWASLYGNYEGAYRNDNGQTDPGISSLFDFTPGKLGLLGDQFASGDLNTDRRAVGNLFLSYNIGPETPMLHSLRRLTVGVGLRGQSGVPLSLLGDHPIYLDQGEIPIGGRGAAGRTPSTLQLDTHVDYSVPLGATLSHRCKLAMDMFNITNSQFETGRVQYTQIGGSLVGVPPPLNLDYNRPTSFQTPFYARGSVRFEF